MVAVLEIAGQQYRAEPEAILEVPRLDLPEGSELTLSRVLYLAHEGGVEIGRPWVEGAEVKARLLEHRLSPKQVVFRMHRRKGYRKKRGHRQPVSRILVTSIGWGEGDGS